MGTARGVLVLVGLLASAHALGAASPDDLRRAERLAWEKQFAQSEALYRRILADDPQSIEARLGLARVVMWQGRYAAAIDMFARLDGIDALEGRATAEYWSGDLRRAARHFRRVLALDANREFARRSLHEILSTATPSQRMTVQGAHDDQPYDALRSQIEARFFSDPQTRWGVIAGGYRLDADRIGRANGQYVMLENETRLRALTFGGSFGIFTFPDGARRPIGSASIRYRTLSLRVEHREELASATSLRTHASSTTAALRWDYDRNLVAAAELSHRSYFDDNSARALVAYAVVPFKRNELTYWVGASATARDSDKSRFRMTAISSTLDGTFFRYQYRGEYDPYWTPDDLFEARAVVAVERRFTRGGIKLHGDAGYARDRGRAFGPDVGPGPFPASTFTFAFDRTYRPWRAGLTGDLAIAPSLRVEAGIERGATVDYRSTTFHAALVRRR
jgi:tetratricopeptide (TPR) repeat protein